MKVVGSGLVGCEGLVSDKNVSLHVVVVLMKVSCALLGLCGGPSLAQVASSAWRICAEDRFPSVPVFVSKTCS